MNPDLDIGFMRTVCRTLIGTSRELGVDADMVPVWQDVLDHLSPYPTKSVDGKELFTNEAERGRIDMHGQPVNMKGAVHPGRTSPWEATARFGSAWTRWPICSPGGWNAVVPTTASPGMADDDAAWLARAGFHS